MISISTKDLAYRIGTREILAGVSFSLEEGDRLAVVGVNGSGKSTLLKMLCGEYTPDEGEVYIARDKIIGMLHQDDAFNVIGAAGGSGDSPIDDTVLGQMYAVFPELCAAEVKLEAIRRELETTPPDDIAKLERLSAEFDSVNNRYIRDGGLHYKSRCRSILISLGFSEDVHSRPVSTMSGGQRTRLALARLLSREPDVLILDEPTNHLDTDTMLWLEGHLASYNPKKTVILVSHDRLFLDRVTNKTLDVEHCRAKLYKCSYSRYVVEKEEARRAWEKEYNIQQKEIARLEAYIEQQRRWNRERNIIAAESREKAIARMDKVEKPKDAPKSIRFTLSSSGESGNDVVMSKGLTMGFGDNVLFRDLSFLVKKGTRTFISGPNGCGKSTLIKLLLGQIEPLSGEIEFGYNVTVGYYDQENQNLNPQNTVLEELWSEYPHLTQTEIRNTLALFLFRGDDIEKEVRVLSGGERARLTLAKLILSKMNLLILDEPTNHLDTDTLFWLEEHLRSYPKTLLLVSHDRYFLDRTATKILDIENTKATIYTGNYTAFAKQKAEARARQQKMYDLQQKEIARIEGIIQTQIHFGQEHNYITIASKKKQIEHMEKVDAPENAPGSIRLAFAEAAESGNDVLEVNDLSKSFGERQIFSDISFMVKKRDHVMVLGPNGCGKSTLIKILGGFEPADSGVIEYGTGVVAGYYDQEQRTLDENNTVLEELWSAHEKLSITQIRTALASFLFFAEDIEKKVSVLSGGEKARLMLCKMILSKINLLILDEPTNHLDIASREALENALLSFGGTIIAVSHDRYFMKKLSTRIFDMGGGFYDYHGTFDEYLEFKEKRRVETVAVKVEKTESENKQKYMENKKLTAEIRKAEKRIERAEAEIEKLDDEKAALEEEMNGEAATNYVRLSEISARLAEIEARCDELFLDMEEAEEFLSQNKI